MHSMKQRGDEKGDFFGSGGGDLIKDLVYFYSERLTKTSMHRQTAPALLKCEIMLKFA